MHVTVAMVPPRPTSAFHPSPHSFAHSLLTLFLPLSNSFALLSLSPHLLCSGQDFPPFSHFLLASSIPLPGCHHFPAAFDSFLFCLFLPFPPHLAPFLFPVGLPLSHSLLFLFLFLSPHSVPCPHPGHHHGTLLFVCFSFLFLILSLLPIHNSLLPAASSHLPGWSAASAPAPLLALRAPAA